MEGTRPVYVEVSGKACEKTCNVQMETT